MKWTRRALRTPDNIPEPREQFAIQQPIYTIGEHSFIFYEAVPLLIRLASADQVLLRPALILWNTNAPTIAAALAAAANAGEDPSLRIGQQQQQQLAPYAHSPPTLAVLALAGQDVEFVRGASNPLKSVRIVRVTSMLCSFSPMDKPTVRYAIDAAPVLDSGPSPPAGPHEGNSEGLVGILSGVTTALAVMPVTMRTRMRRGGYGFNYTLASIYKTAKASLSFLLPTILRLYQFRLLFPYLGVSMATIRPHPLTSLLYQSPR